jgi:hypothetical protein
MTLSEFFLCWAFAIMVAIAVWHGALRREEDRDDDGCGCDCDDESWP